MASLDRCTTLRLRRESASKVLRWTESRAPAVGVHVCLSRGYSIDFTTRSDSWRTIQRSHGSSVVPKWCERAKSVEHTKF